MPAEWKTGWSISSGVFNLLILDVLCFSLPINWIYIIEYTEESDLFDLVVMDKGLCLLCSLDGHGWIWRVCLQEASRHTASWSTEPSFRRLSQSPCTNFWNSWISWRNHWPKGHKLYLYAYSDIVCHMSYVCTYNHSSSSLCPPLSAFSAFCTANKSVRNERRVTSSSTVEWFRPENLQDMAAFLGHGANLDNTISWSLRHSHSRSRSKFFSKSWWTKEKLHKIAFNWELCLLWIWVDSVSCF